MDGANSAMQGRLGFKQIDKQRLTEKAAKLRKAGLAELTLEKKQDL